MKDLQDLKDFDDTRCKSRLGGPFGAVALHERGNIHEIEEGPRAQPQQVWDLAHCPVHLRYGGKGFINSQTRPLHANE